MIFGVGVLGLVVVPHQVKAQSTKPQTTKPQTTKGTTPVTPGTMSPGTGTMTNHPTPSSGSVGFNPAVNYFTRPFGVGATVNGPASYSWWNTPNSSGGLLVTRSMFTWAYSPFYGPSFWYTSPSVVGWSWTPFFGYQSYTIPGVTSVASPYYTGYVPFGFIVP